MGNLTHTVSGDIASFRSAARVPIESLKCHFLPIQEGTGDPSPTNIRPITGWIALEGYKTGINLWDEQWEPGTISSETGYNAVSSKPGTIRSKNYIPVYPGQKYYCCYPNKSTEEINSSLKILAYDKDKKYIDYWWKPLNNRSITIPDNAFFIRFNLRNDYGTIYTNDISINYPYTDNSYHPYHGQTIPITFPIVGKNKFNWDVEQGHAFPTTSDASTARTYPLNTYIIGVSGSNYYRDNYTNWVLNPSVSNGTISFSSGGAAGYGIGFPLNLVPKQTYFISGTRTGGGTAAALYYDANGAMISSQINKFNNTITIPENTVTTMIVFYASEPQKDYTFSNIQLELGSTATTYEPYSSDNTVYGGYVDVAKGEVVETYASIILDGSSDEPWSKSGDNQTWSPETFVMHWDEPGILSTNPKIYDQCLCDSAIVSHNVHRDPQDVNGIHVSFYHYSNIGFHAPLGANATVSQLRAYLTEHPLHIISPYVKETRYKHYPLTPIQLKTFLDQNNIWSNTNDITEVSYQIHDSNMIKNIKKQIIHNTQPKLKYWLCGDDAPVNGKWIERINKLPFTLYNGADWDSENKYYIFDTPSKGAALDGTSNSNNFYIGHHWQFDFDIWANRDKSKDNMIFFDIGSVTSANKALGFGAGPKSDSGYNGHINWKLNGNSSSPFSGQQTTHPCYPITPKDEYVHLIGSYKMVSGNDGYDRLIVTVNGQTVKYDTILIPKAEYGPTWHTNKLCVGTSVYNYTELINDQSFSSYSPCCYIKDIKIYILD